MRAIPTMVLELRMAAPRPDPQERQRLMDQCEALLAAPPLQAPKGIAHLLNQVNIRSREGIPYYSFGFIRLSVQPSSQPHQTAV